MLKRNKLLTGAIVVILVVMVAGGAITVALASRNTGPHARPSSPSPQNSPVFGGGSSASTPNSPEAKPSESSVLSKVQSRALNKNPDAKQDFSITGSIPDLYPGLSTQLPLTVSNPNNFAIVVTDLKATTITSSKPGCAVTSVTSDAFRGSLPVPSDGSTVTHVTLQMSPEASNACQGAEFKLVYSGVGMKS